MEKSKGFSGREEFILVYTEKRWAQYRKNPIYGESVPICITRHNTIIKFLLNFHFGRKFSEVQLFIE